MRIIIIILFLFNSFAYGQRSRGRAIYDQFKKEDSLEGLYTNDTLPKVITDTLPVYTDDEYSGWRDMKHVSYFYDSSNTLKKVSFRNGREGYYYFYFEGLYLKKARFVKQEYLKYYFTIDDNRYTLSEITQRATQEPEKKDFYEILKMGKAFLEKFKTIL